jgi:hypothetical protein
MEQWMAIMEKIKDEQFNLFKQTISNLKEVSRKEYLCLYLNRFLGDYLSPKIADTVFDAECYDTIDNISLSGPEIYFFHEMVDHKLENDKYIDELIEIYHTVKNLENCTLGKNILRCLTSSKELSIRN